MTASIAVPTTTHQRAGREVPAALSGGIRERGSKTRRGPRASSREVPATGLDEARDEFKAMTACRSNDFPMASVEPMRAGTVQSPHTLVRRFLYAGKRFGMPMSWACRFSSWTTSQVLSLWGDSATPTGEIRRRALLAEGRGNEAEQRVMLLQPGSREARKAEIDCLLHELAVDQELLARLLREYEAMA